MNIDCLPGQSQNSSGILFLRHTYLSNQCDGCTPMHAVLEQKQKQRNPSSQTALQCSDKESTSDPYVRALQGT